MKINKKELLLLILRFLFSLLWLAAKASITVIFVFWAANEFVTVIGRIHEFPIARSKEFAYLIEALYSILLIAISLYLILWTILGLDKKNCIILAICFIIFVPLVFLSQIDLARQRGNCPSNGGVWDYDLQKCRKSCLRQPDEDNCIPESNSK